ncbi:jg3645 [Pararge aegeria aegeria]|uniref:Jg3645 protein n=1 Tax=Pararge aegeria aegeria TaxID=348720 RepID=A0A8S4RI04_9NEOP|nr:jg3645 [Pararge aegeria aegeria]
MHLRRLRSPTSDVIRTWAHNTAPEACGLMTIRNPFTPIQKPEPETKFGLTRHPQADDPLASSSPRVQTLPGKASFRGTPQARVTLLNSLGLIE